MKTQPHFKNTNKTERRKTDRGQKKFAHGAENTDGGLIFQPGTDNTGDVWMSKK